MFVNLSSTTLANICQTSYEYIASSSLVSQTTQLCYNPATAFLIEGGVVVAFLVIVISVIKIFK